MQRKEASADPRTSRARFLEHSRHAAAITAASLFIPSKDVLAAGAVANGATGTPVSPPKVAKVTDEIFISDAISSTTELARIGKTMKAFVTLCRTDEPCIGNEDYRRTFPLKPTISLPLGPGLFQVAPTLAVVQQINDLPKPLLISCTTQKRSSGLATIYVALQRGYSAGEALDWAEAHNMPFLQMPAVRNWVVFCIDTSLRGSDGYSASI